MWSLLFLYSLTGKMANEKVRNIQCVRQQETDPDEEVNGSTDSVAGSENERRELHVDDE